MAPFYDICNLAAFLISGFLIIWVPKWDLVSFTTFKSLGRSINVCLVYSLPRQNFWEIIIISLPSNIQILLCYISVYGTSGFNQLYFPALNEKWLYLHAWDAHHSTPILSVLLFRRHCLPKWIKVFKIINSLTPMSLKLMNSLNIKLTTLNFVHFQDTILSFTYWLLDTSFKFTLFIGCCSNPRNCWYVDAHVCHK